MNFKDKKILITGGSQGIGKAILSEFYKEGSRKFAVVGRNIDKMKGLKEEYPEAEFLYLQGDISKPEAIHSIIDEIKTEWVGLDILVNNAGVVSAGKLEDLSDEDIINQQNINVTGLILLTKHALPLLKESREAAIINISSGLGLIGKPFYAVYAATKAGVKQFSEAMRRELDAYNIHVMTIYPTGTDTPMMESTSRGGLDTPELVALKTLEGLKERKIDVILGGEQRIKDNKANFENPLEFDKKIREKINDMQEQAQGHRAM